MSGLPEGVPYQARYCEENAWQLLATHGLAGAVAQDRAWVLVVTNADRTVAMTGQRAGEPPYGVVGWDYHVFVAALTGPADGDRLEAWDPDTVLGLRSPMAQWLRASFGLAAHFGPELQPRFRVVPARAYARGFASDRSHMRHPDAVDRWLAPPPPWARVGVDEAGEAQLGRWLLPAWLDLDDDDVPGLWLDLEGLTTWAAAR